MVIKGQATRLRMWPFIVFVVIIALLLNCLSDKVTFGPHWVSAVVSAGLLISFVMALVFDNPIWIRWLSVASIFVLTVKLISSIYFLVFALFTNAPHGKVLFIDAGLLWIANILTFALWYWSVDQGGEQRRYENKLVPSDFIFPQMTMNSVLWNEWKPSFVDYMFLAFNVSTAFSPTDTLILSKRMKVILMTQASISLIIVGVLAARAIGS